jgi:hypothetical protein
VVPMMAVVDVAMCGAGSIADLPLRSAQTANFHRETAPILSEGPQATGRVPRKKYQGMAGSLVKVKVTPGS